MSVKARNTSKKSAKPAGRRQRQQVALPPEPTASPPPLPTQPPVLASASAGMKHVALLIETTGSYGRGLLTGVAKYNRLHGRWSTYARPWALTDPLPKWLASWKGDGIIARIETPEMARVLMKTGVPIVNLRGTVAGLPYPYVSIDNEAVARLAAQHLQERGLRVFAFVGKAPGTNPALDARGEFFKQIVEQAGGVCHVFRASPVDPKIGWEAEQDELADWIARLPRPVGIMACNDERGLQVLDACRRANIAVPDEVAVIGVDNDEPLCEIAIPPMSSVEVNAETIGYEAAALLDRMMAGQTVSTATVRVAPKSVVVRRSTDVIACEDSEVAGAVRFIRENACKRLLVVDVLMHMGMSRASLQQRMKALLGRTIHQEIQRVRLARAKELLVCSDLTIKQVARESGFTSVQYMTRAFRAMTGETPARYRSSRTK